MADPIPAPVRLAIRTEGPPDMVAYVAMASTMGDRFLIIAILVFAL